MRTKEEIGEKIEELNELQSIMLTSTLTSNEEQVRNLLQRFNIRAFELNEKYEEASQRDDQMEKNQIHAMIWTNDIRIDTLKWVLEEEDVGI